MHAWLRLHPEPRLSTRGAASLLTALLLAPPTVALNESEALVRALVNNPDIRVYVLDRTADSLGLEKERAAWLPATAIGATVSKVPGEDETWGELDVSVTQSIPGGGTVSASVNPQLSYFRGADSASSSTHYSIGVEQPLARNAWRHGATCHGLRIRRLDSRIFNLEHRKKLAGELSTIRSTYWTWYARQRTLRISADAKAQAERLQATERARYRVGEAAAIDTLRATLELLKAEQTHLADQIAAAQARNDLSEALMLPPDDLDLPDSVDVVLMEPPGARSFLERVRDYDPQRGIFELLREKLELQLNHDRQELLPDVSLEASYGYTDPSSGGPSIAANSVFSLILNYSLPTKRRRISVAQSRLALQENEIRTEEHEAATANRVNELIDSWELEKRKLAISEASQQVALQLLAAAEKGHAVGTVDQLDYLKARDDAVAQSVHLLQQKLALKRLELVFDELTGNVLTKFGVTVE